MKMIKLLVIAALIVFGFNWWKGGKAPQTVTASSPNGFMSVAMPGGAAANTVIILAPVDCPEEAAQRADKLAAGLNRMNIPNVRSDSYNANVNNPSAEEKAKLDRAVQVINGTIPAVFINGMAKANPTIDDVVAEYQRTK